MTQPAPGASSPLMQLATERTATALAALLGHPLTAESRVLPGAPDTAALWRERGLVAVRFSAAGSQGYEFLVALPLESVETVKRLLAPGMEGSSEMDDAIVTEIGNICAGHFLSTLGDVLQVALLPTLPVIVRPGAAGAGVDGLVEPDGLLVQAEFRAPSGESIVGFMQFRPAELLLAALGQAPGASG